MSQPNWILLKGRLPTYKLPGLVKVSEDTVYHLMSHAWGSRDSSGLVTRCGINNLSLEIVGAKPLPDKSLACEKCFKGVLT